ncbi:MAG: hypothetical protein WD872_18610 [Pirellulaceae bacterium]
MPAKQRILVCRAGFVLFCALPTLLVGLWIVRRSSEGFAAADRAEWQRELTSRLGLVVEIRQVSYPGYCVARLEGFRLADPETGASMFAAQAVEVALEGGEWRIEAWQPQVAAAQLRPLAQRLHDRLLCGPAGSLAECQLVARELTIVGERGGQSLVNVVGRFELKDGVNPQLAATFQLPAASDPAAVARLSVGRQRDLPIPTTTWQLDTGGEWLPCWLLAAADLDRLGQACNFAGTVAVTDSPAGLSGSLAGSLDEVDLDALVTEHFPHVLSGLGRVRIERAALRDGKLVGLRGSLQVRNGAIGESLLAAAAEHLQLDRPPARPAAIAEGSLPFRQLSLGFHLDGRLLKLSGNADPTQPGALLASAGGPLLTAPSRHAVPAVHLLRTLLTENQFQVPATRQTDALIGLLPVPDLVPTRTASRQRPHTPTRLRTSGPLEAAPVIRPPVFR